MKETQMPPAHAANLVANSGNALYGVLVITCQQHSYGFLNFIATAALL